MQKFFAIVLLLIVIPIFSGCAPTEEPKPEAPRILTKEEKLKAQFSAWDGSHIMLVKYIKDSMNDPDSFEHVETRAYDKKKKIFLACKFRGKNAFGGIVTNVITAEVDDEGNLLRIVE